MRNRPVAHGTIAKYPGPPTPPRILERDFGLSLDFEPTRREGDTLEVTVKATFRGVDFENASVRKGYFIPGVSVSSLTETVEVQNGDAFAITGLFNEAGRGRLSQIPGLMPNGIGRRIMDRQQAQDNTAPVLIIEFFFN